MSHSRGVDSRVRELRKPYNVIPNPAKTRSRIIMVAAELFACNGYAEVSIRDIGRAVGVKSASLYGHFSGKQAILESIMAIYEKELYRFYRMLDKLSQEAGSLQEILQNIFAEVEVNVNPFSYYACWVAINTQYNFEASRHLYHDIFFMEGHEVMKRQLRTAVERGLVQPFDVEACGVMITNCITTTIGFHVGQIMGFHKDFDVNQWCRSTVKQVLLAAGEPVPEGW